MKLTRSELIHATDKQLAVLNIVRKSNAGWLMMALGLDFNERAIAEFRSADTRSKPVRDNESLYMELLYAVERKHHGESRHETALRYIREAEKAENRPSDPASNLSPEEYANRLFTSNRDEFTESTRC